VIAPKVRRPLLATAVASSLCGPAAWLKMALARVRSSNAASNRPAASSSAASWYQESAITPGGARFSSINPRHRASACATSPKRRSIVASAYLAFSNPGATASASAAHCRAASKSCSRSYIFASSSSVCGRSGEAGSNSNARR
jgi:hypothetical protein